MNVRVEVQDIPDAVQTLALHDFGTCGGEETLVFVGECDIQEMGNYVVKNGIAQEFKPLVVGPFAGFNLDWLGAVHNSQFVQVDIAGIVASDAMYKNIKLLLLDEKQLYE